jgi:hypothetical protein
MRDYVKRPFQAQVRLSLGDWVSGSWLGREASVGGRQWRTEVAGLPCSIEMVSGGWVVTVASTTRSRRSELAAAILDAGAGLVREHEAVALAASVQVRLGFARGGNKGV